MNVLVLQLQLKKLGLKYDVVRNGNEAVSQVPKANYSVILVFFKKFLFYIIIIIVGNF